MIYVAALVPTLCLVPRPTHAQTSATPSVPAAMQFMQAGATWGQILADRKTLTTAIEERRLSAVHDLIYTLRDAVVTLPFKSNALSPEKKAALTEQINAVAALVDTIDADADARRLDETRAGFEAFGKHLDAIAGLFPEGALPTEGQKTVTAADRALFLIPGGVYTASDVKANGNTSPAVRYPNYIPAHEAKVIAGSQVCPISETRPDPALKWIIGGKEYIFCCPPCITEFVQKAKKSPAIIKSPREYKKN